jgi:hypothetical protein
MSKKRREKKLLARIKARAENRRQGTPRPKVDQEMPEPFAGENDWEQQLQRILSVLGVSSEEEADVTDDTLETYFDYMRQNLSMPCTLTGIEDMGCFGWEEYYTWGPGSKREYNKLKKSRPSYTDEYELLGFHEDELYEDEGILVHVKRTSDGKKFTLSLSDLEDTDKQSRNAQLVNDYVTWFVNYR